MRRLLALLLVAAITMTGCAGNSKNKVAETAEEAVESTTTSSIPEVVTSQIASETVTSIISNEVVNDDNEADDNAIPSVKQADLYFEGIDDEDFLPYVESLVYDDLVALLDESYVVESVDATYVSQEYIDAVAFNSQSSIYFGYTLDELNDYFDGTRYVFTLDDNKQTSVKALEEIPDTDADTIMKNVAIGTGVILVCVVVSCVAPAVGAPAAVTAIITASADGAATLALSSGVISAVSSGIIRGYQTGDMNEAFQAAVLEGSEGFKWGAISGAVLGGAEEAVLLKMGTKAGLTMSEVAVIQKESNWSLSAIKKIHSMEEYTIYKNAGLVPTKLSNGSTALIREIDWTLVDSKGLTNVERVIAGKAPIDSSGMPLELHHIGQKADSPLAILTWAEHHAEGNFKNLHYSETGKGVPDAVWKEQKEAFWKEILSMAQKAGIV